MNRILSYLNGWMIWARHLTKTTLSCWVWYRGSKYLVVNGTRCGSWRLKDLDNGDSGWVLREECSKVWTIPNILASANYMRGWYMAYWHSIYSRKGGR